MHVKLWANEICDYLSSRNTTGQGVPIVAQYAQRTCSECGFQDIQPRMIAKKVRHESVVKEKPSAGDWLMLAIGKDSEMKRAWRKIVTPDKYVHRSSETIFLCEDCAGGRGTAAGRGKSQTLQKQVTEKRDLARRAEIAAAKISEIDHQIGEISHDVIGFTNSVKAHATGLWKSRIPQIISDGVNIRTLSKAYKTASVLRDLAGFDPAFVEQFQLDAIERKLNGLSLVATSINQKDPKLMFEAAPKTYFTGAPGPVVASPGRQFLRAVLVVLTAISLLLSVTLVLATIEDISLTSFVLVSGMLITGILYWLQQSAAGRAPLAYETGLDTWVKLEKRLAAKIEKTFRDLEKEVRRYCAQSFDPKDVRRYCESLSMLKKLEEQKQGYIQDVLNYEQTALDRG